MHKRLPTPVQRLGVWLAAVLIFAAAPLASWVADTLNPAPPAPARVSSTQTPARARTVVTHRLEEDEPGWDCRTDGNAICGNGTGVDLP